MILGIETATPICSVGIAEGDRVLAETSFDVKNLHDRVLAEAIQQLLHWNGVELSQLHAIAISAGPGSFTGLRIGMGVAKGLAFTDDKPILAVNTLLLQAAAAASYAQAFAEGRHLDVSAVQIVPVLHSRRGEIYTATYRLQSALPARMAPERAITISDFPAAHSGVAVWCGNGIAALREAGLLSHREDVFVLAGQEARLSGGLAAQIGDIKYRRGEITKAEALEPFYVKEPV